MKMLPRCKFVSCALKQMQEDTQIQLIKFKLSIVSTIIIFFIVFKDECWNHYFVPARVLINKRHKCSGKFLKPITVVDFNGNILLQLIIFPLSHYFLSFCLLSI